MKFFKPDLSSSEQQIILEFYLTFHALVLSGLGVLYLIMIRFYPEASERMSHILNRL